MIKLSKQLSTIWYPGMQMKDFETIQPIPVTHAQGDYIYTPTGKIIDAISSWWCKPLGHRHPAVTKAIQQQLQRFEHVMPAYATHETLHLLGEKLSQLSQLPYALFACDGASAVEIALKLTIHARYLKNEPEKRRFLSLRHSYHGETLGTLSVGDLAAFKAPYESHTFPAYFIDVPYQPSPKDTFKEADWDALYIKLEAIKSEINALIVEPLVQGSYGMQCYSQAFLKRLMRWAKANGIYCIADEMMTGFCRTGQWFACDHIQETPDLICVGKGLTNGTLPLSATLVSQSLYDLFYNDAETGRNFIHSHTHSANALAVAAAYATLYVLENENFNQQAIQLEQKLYQAFDYLKDKTGRLENIRGIGGIIAADLVLHPLIKRPGFQFYQEAIKRGALLRPIGQTLYWFPPLNIADETLEELTKITYESIMALYHERFAVKI